MTEKRLYELVPYDCQEGICLMIHEKTTDNKLGALSLDHRGIAEAIVNELNDLSEKWYIEQKRTTPITLNTHISDEDFERLEKMFKKYYGR